MISHAKAATSAVIKTKIYPTQSRSMHKAIIPPSAMEHAADAAILTVADATKCHQESRCQHCYPTTQSRLYLRALKCPYDGTKHPTKIGDGTTQLHRRAPLVAIPHTKTTVAERSKTPSGNRVPCTATRRHKVAMACTHLSARKVTLHTLPRAGHRRRSLHSPDPSRSRTPRLSP